MLQVCLQTQFYREYKMSVSKWSILNFGRHKNKSLPQVVLCDPTYFFRANDTFVFQLRGYPEARGLAYKARNIKIPKPDGEHWSIVYDYEPPGTTEFRGFRLVQVSTAEEVGLRHLDLSVVYRRYRSDKLANKCLVRDFKLHYFGKPFGNLSREECEEFFDCDAKFYEEATLPRELWRPFPGSALTEAPW
jgi:hypothetical protein